MNEFVSNLAWRVRPITISLVILVQISSGQQAPNAKSKHKPRSCFMSDPAHALPQSSPYASPICF